MSLTALPVTQAQIETLQTGIESFSSPTEAATLTTAINGGSQSVASYAAVLLDRNLSLSQVAMGVHSVMISTPSIATFANITQNFLPGQVTVAIANGFNPTVYAAEACGLALASNATFQSNFAVQVTFNSATKLLFCTLLADKTGVNSTAIAGFLDNWISFYTSNPAVGLTASQAAAGATAGDAIGVALTNGTTANLKTFTNTGHITGLVANALVDIALGTYSSGVALSALPTHSLVQGEI